MLLVLVARLLALVLVLVLALVLVLLVVLVAVDQHGSTPMAACGTQRVAAG